MKKILYVIASLLLVMTVAGCKKRTNSAGTLKLESKKGSAYVVESVDESLKLGTIYYLVEDETLTGIRIVVGEKFKVTDFALTIGSDHAQVNEPEKKTGTIEYKLPTPLKLTYTEDEKYKANSKTIKVYVKAEDVNKGLESYQGTLEKDSTTTVSVTCESLIEFCLDKEI